MDSALPSVSGGAVRRRPVVALVLVAGLLAAAPAAAVFPEIPLWSHPGLQANSVSDTSTITQRPRSITLRWKRDRLAEARDDFGGYRIYRVVAARDSSRMVLLRRFSRQVGDEIMWGRSTVDTTDLLFKLNGVEAGDSIMQFVDPDSAGNFVKVCKRVDRFDRCLSIGDSVYRLIPPPGPHDGYSLYYTITYEARNTIDNNYEDLFVPDTLDTPGLTQAERYARCDTVGRPGTCPNRNNKTTNLMVDPVIATGGPTTDVERVAVVPNPYRSREPWDPPGQHEVHFINLPSQARIRIYTVAGDLVADLRHNDEVLDFERWNLKNANGEDVASGIYIYRVEAGSFFFQDRFIVVR